MHFIKADPLGESALLPITTRFTGETDEVKHGGIIEFGDAIRWSHDDNMWLPEASTSTDFGIYPEDGPRVLCRVRLTFAYEDGRQVRIVRHHYTDDYQTSHTYETVGELLADQQERLHLADFDALWDLVSRNSMLRAEMEAL